jgi:hypothetical protein
MLVKTITYTEPTPGDEVKVDSIFRDDITLYICHIEGDLIYISWDKKATKGECESFFSEDVTIIVSNKPCEHRSYRSGHSPFVPCICNDCGEEL